FHDELVRAVELGADYLVMHPGSSCGTDTGRCILTIADSLRQAARGLKLNGLTILLENTAGQGSTIGSRFEELQAVREGARDLPLAFCVDTAHLFAAGNDIRSEPGLDQALQMIDASVGLDNVPVFHVNDSKTPLGSRVDRHEHIGKGHIGLDAFRRILNHPLLAGRAFILETPIDKPGDDRRNVAALWKLIGVAVKQAPGAGHLVRRPPRKAGKTRAKARAKAGTRKKALKRGGRKKNRK
ncbi:MAG: deoxyribonuclease IV, partial [Candidatus Acidiferrales bacterium]